VRLCGFIVFTGAAPASHFAGSSSAISAASARRSPGSKRPRLCCTA
jgi:hypothetical protein